MSAQINRAPSPSTSQSSVTWHNLTNLFPAPCPSSSFPVCQLCSCGFCTAPSLCGWVGRNLVVLASASSPFSWRGPRGHSHSTVLCGHIYSLWDRFRVSVTIFFFFYCGQNNAIVRRSLRSILCLSVIIYILKNRFTWCSCCLHPEEQMHLTLCCLYPEEQIHLLHLLFTSWRTDSLNALVFMSRGTDSLNAPVIYILRKRFT